MTFDTFGNEGTTGNPTGPISSKLGEINAVLLQLTPLIGSTMLLTRLIVAIAKRTGTDIGPFEQEIAKLDASLTNAQTAIDDFNARFGAGDEPTEPAEPSQ